MNNITLSRTLAGAGIILVGLTALLGSLNIVDFGNLFATYWPTLVIAAGLLMLLANPREQYMWSALFIILGILWQLRALEAIDFNVWSLFWPLVLIALGWSIMINRAGAAASILSDDSERIAAVLGGISTKVESRNYTGSKITAVLGGSVVDLRHAEIKKEATLEVFTFMGGIEIKVPEGWTVQSSVMPVLGGVEDKTVPSSGKSAPVLNIIGTAILGGIEVKH